MSYQDAGGRRGEKAIYNYLISNNYDVEDVSNNPLYWNRDIDVIATKNGKRETIEIKNDTCIGKTGNAYIEHTQDIDNDEPGWFRITEAQKLYYRDDQNEIVYVIDMDDLRQYIKDKKGQLAERKARPNDVGKVSVGYLVPVWDLQTIYPVIEIRA